MQLLRSEGKTHYILSLNKQVKNDQVVCIEELKLSLLAKSCLCPGLIALITNLIKSSADVDEKNLNYSWLKEYSHGKGFEIYKTPLSQKFNGLTFSKASRLIYRNFNAILFAIDVVDDKENSAICINPGKLKLPDRGKLVGYIIASDKEVADRIRDYEKNKDPMTHAHLNYAFDEINDGIKRTNNMKNYGSLYPNQQKAYNPNQTGYRGSDMNFLKKNNDSIMHKSEKIGLTNEMDEDGDENETDEEGEDDSEGEKIKTQLTSD